MKQLGFLCAALFCACFARADGCYIPKPAVLKIPEITGQRALLTWRNGTETLTLSSTLDSDAQQLGWIIPLPSVPDQLEKASPGALKTLPYCIQPRLVRGSDVHLLPWLLLLGTANVLLYLFLFSVPRPTLVEVLTVLGILFTLCTSLYPSVYAPGSFATRAIAAEKTAQVGAYDIAVLRPKQASDLNGWLAQTGLQTLPAAAEPAVDAYIRDGWVFAAVALSRDQAGANTPHPLRLTFKAREPVYPMRLTALARSVPRLELYVVSDGRLSCDRLATAFCDRLREVPGATNAPSGTEARHFVGVHTWQRIGHPQLCDQLWDGCVLTQLTGSLSSAQMSDDLRFRRERFSPFRQTFYTKDGCAAACWRIGLWGVGGALIFVQILWAQRLRQPRGVRWLLRTVIAPTLALCAAGGWAFRTLAPTLSEDEIVRGSRARNVTHTVHIHQATQALLQQHPDLLSRSEPELARAILTQLEQREAGRDRPRPANPLTGGNLEAEDSPGNFTVEKRDGKILLRVYRASGQYWQETFPR